MKKRPHNRSNESAKEQGDCNPGRLPHRQNTVTAAVLAGFLEGQKFTGMEAVFEQHTTRLSDVVFRLSERYGWTIERRDIATDTKDGRVAWITEYWLSQATRAAAFDAGARPWITDVKTARTKLRNTADKRKAEAARISATHKQVRKQDPRQFGFLGDDL